MPGPIADCAKSTGAILSTCKILTADAISSRSAEINSPLVAIAAEMLRFRHERTIEVAKAFAPTARILFPSSVLIGHVAVIVQPLWSKAVKNVSQPVDSDPSDSVALNA